MVLLYFAGKFRQHHVDDIPCCSIYGQQISIGIEQAFHTAAWWYRFKDGILGEIGELCRIFCIFQKILHVELDQPCGSKLLSHLLNTPSFRDRSNQVVRLSIEQLVDDRINSHVWVQVISPCLQSQSITDHALCLQVVSNLERSFTILNHNGNRLALVCGHRLKDIGGGRPCEVDCSKNQEAEQKDRKDCDAPAWPSFLHISMPFVLLF